MADGFLSALGRRTEEMRDRAEDYGRGTSRRLRHRRDDARGELRRLWSQLEDVVERQLAPRASDYAREARETARDYAREGRDRAMDAAVTLRDVARARPLLAIGVAVLATWVVANLVSRGRR